MILRRVDGMFRLKVAFGLAGVFDKWDSRSSSLRFKESPLRGGSEHGTSFTTELLVDL
jgi:hypothetical protein